VKLMTLSSTTRSTPTVLDVGVIVVSSGYWPMKVVRIEAPDRVTAGHY
jgi:hypothetical protein